MRPERRWLAAASLAALLAGCTDFAPKYHAPIVAVPTSFKETGDWQKADPKDTIPRGPWWSIYHDAVLNKLEDQLNAANPDIAAAVAHYDSSRAFVSEINSVLFPSVGTGGAASQFGWNGTGSAICRWARANVAMVASPTPSAPSASACRLVMAKGLTA